MKRRSVLRIELITAVTIFVIVLTFSRANCDEISQLSYNINGGRAGTAVTSETFPKKMPNQVEFHTRNLPNGKHSVQYWKKAQAKIKKEYNIYWAAFAGRENDSTSALLSQHILSANSQPWGTLYKLSITKDKETFYKKLKDDSSFINLEPFYAKEKIHEDIYNERSLKYANSSSKTFIAVVDIWRSSNKCGVLSLIKRYSDSVFPDVDCKSVYHVRTDRSRILKLSQYDMIQNIYPYKKPIPVDWESREITKTNALQLGHLDTTSFPPTVSWNGDSIYSGDSIWLGVAYSFDTSKLDFKESRPSNNDTLVRLAPMPGSHNWNVGGAGTDPHDTHCLGIAAGNGWQSSIDQTGGSQYLWRGVAPKARIANTIDGLSQDCDVNSFSYAFEADGYYTDFSNDEDNELSTHDTADMNDNNVAVFATANNGGPAAYYGVQQAYYSMLNNTKNGIKVGSVQKQSGDISWFSSMGPTRDGRLGPDIMAPGSNCSEEKFVTQIQYIRVIDSIGNIKKEWNFNGTNAGWVRSDYHTDSLKIDASAISLYGSESGAIISDTLSPNLVGHSKDSLVIRFKANDSNAPGYINRYQKRLANYKLFWQLPGDAHGSKWYSWNNDKYFVYFYGMLNDDWKELRLPLSKIQQSDANGGWTDDHRVWPTITSSTQNVVRIALVPCSNSILSVNALGQNSIYGYCDENGTSMATPYVAGIVALMLQKYKKIYNVNIHNHPFWNSTAKAILVHTATDMVDTIGRVEGWNYDFDTSAASGGWKQTVYGVGPDWATGYGLVNAQKALQYTDKMKFKEDTVANHELKVYSFYVAGGTSNSRVTLAWDDPGPGTGNDPSNCFQQKLVNGLNLYLVSPTGVKYLPWRIDHSMLNNGVLPPNGMDSLVTRPKILANPAYPDSGDTLNNVNVVDVSHPLAGKWTAVVNGYKIISPQSPYSIVNKQDFSIVSDTVLTSDTDKTGCKFNYNGQSMAVNLLNGELKLKQCFITGSYSGLLFKKNGTAEVSISADGNIHGASISSNQSTWLDNAANLSGGLLIRGSDGVVKSHFAGDGTIRIRSNQRCYTL